MKTVNPYRDILTGREYLDVYQRQQRYSQNYDNDERDRDPRQDITDIFDAGGDSSVGSSMRFQSHEALKTYSTTRFNGTEDRYSMKMSVSFLEQNGKVEIVQYTDSNGDGQAEVHRLSVVDTKTARILKMYDL